MNRVPEKHSERGKAETGDSIRNNPRGAVGELIKESGKDW